MRDAIRPLRLALAGAGLLALALPAAASACRLPSAVQAIVHSGLPDRLPDGVVALELRFDADADLRTIRHSGARAAVVRLLSGDGGGALDSGSVLVRPSRWTSCSYPFANGRSGIVVGRLRMLDGTAILDPYWVSRRNGFRLAWPSRE